MRIAFINGSPKVKNSASGALLEDLKSYFSETNDILDFGFHTTDVSEKVKAELMTADAWVFAFPLYVDGIPGHLLSCLAQLGEENAHDSKRQVYGIVNCGFYEGIQAKLALKILQNWCTRTNNLWGGGIGIGGGGGLAMMPKLEPGQGPKAPIDKALSALAEKIQQQDTQQNCYVSVAFPRFAYKLGAQMGWRQMIKANGKKARNLADSPE